MRRITVLVAVSAVLLLAGCASSDPGQGATPAPAPSASRVVAGKAACRAAVKAQYAPGTAKLTGAPTQPPECAGLSADVVSQIVLDVVAENTK